MSSNRFLNSDSGGGISNPYNGVLSVIDLETQKYFSANDELQKIDNFEESELNKTNITGAIECDDVLTSQIADKDSQTCRIELNDTDINVISQNFTYNGTDIATAETVEPLTQKTTYIQLPIDNNGTRFQNTVFADSFALNQVDEAKKLYSDGTTTNIGDLIFLDNNPPINVTTDRTYLDRNLNIYAPSDAGFPVQPSVLIYDGNVFLVYTENDFNTEYSDGATFLIMNNITLTSSISFNRSVKLTAINSSIKLTANIAGALIIIDEDNCLISGITLENTSTSPVASCINFIGTNLNSWVTNCELFTNEIAITSNIKNLVINANTFKYIGSPDSHQYIVLTGLLGNCFVTNNTFWGNSLTVPNTQCISINTGSANNFLNANLIIKGNTTGSVVQRLLMVNIALTASNMSFYISNNVMETWQGYIMFFVNPLLGVKQIYLINNTEILGGSPNTGSYGMISLDSAVFDIITFDTIIYSAKNTIPLLRPAYFDLTNPDAKQPRTIAYLNAVFNPTQTYNIYVPQIGNANSGAVVTIDISGLEAKTQNLTATTSLNTLTKNTKMTISGAESFEVKDVLGTSRMIVNNTNTTMTGNVIASAFVKSGGTNQQYLMADGTSLTYSSNSGNSNFYLYTSSDSGSTTPTGGQITYNNAVQANATIIYISHVTSDNNIDIEVYFKQLSALNEVYIQDRNISENFIQYNIIGTPTITVGSKVAIPVAVRTSGGTGSTSFGNTHPVLLSFFVNSIETDTRLSTLETKTQNLGASSTFSTLNKSVTVILDNVGTFIVRDELLNQLLSVAPTICNIFKQLNMNNNNIINVSSITSSQFKTPLGLDTDFLKANGTIDSNYYMPSDPAYTSGGIAYIGITNGLLTSNSSNKYCQAGIDNLQTVINTVLNSQDQNIQLSAGTHTVSNLLLTKNAYSISGALCPTYQPSTILNTNTTIGSAVNTSLIKLSHIIFIGTLTFFSSATAQQLRYGFYNCQFNGTITYPTAVFGSSGFIYFTDCIISYGTAITFNSIICNIVFTRCKFNNNVIINNAPVGQIVFDNCSGLNSLTVTNATFKGINSVGLTNQLVATGVSLSGASTSFLMGNGSVNATKYCNIQAISLSSVSNTGITEVILNPVASIGSYNYSDSVIGSCREWVFHGTTSRSSNTTSTYTLRHKTSGTENMLLTMPASNNATVANLAFVLRFRVVRYLANAVSWSGQWTDAERTWSFYTTQNAGGGIVPLNTSATYTITFQASNANTTILIHHVDVNNIYV